jgi:hypothetical protein
MREDEVASLDAVTPARLTTATSSKVILFRVVPPFRKTIVLSLCQINEARKFNAYEGGFFIV